MQRIIKLDERNKIISERRGTTLQDGEIFSDKGMVGQVMVSDRIFENDIYCSATDITNKIVELYTLCGNDIVNKFESDAYQGVNKSYDFAETDQINISGLVLDMVIDALIDSGIDVFSDIEYFATDEDCVTYTGEEFRQLWKDGMVHKFTLVQKYKALKELAKGCTLKSELEEIKWSE